MQRRLLLGMSVLSVAAALSAACGSSSTLASNLAPSSSVTVTSLSLTMNTPSVGSGLQATATATFSNGTTTPVASGFTSDTPSVATVTSAGAVTGVSIGDVTISVDFQGQHASKKVHVLPSYGGIFIGSYNVSACTETGGFVNADPTQDFCSVFVVGAAGGIAFNTTQSSDLTSMTALFLLGSLGVQGTGAGTISPAGALAFTGSLIAGTSRVDLTNFAAMSPTPGRETGSFTMTFTDSTLTGSGIVTATNLDMTRQASAASMSPSAVTLPGAHGWRSLLHGASLR